MNLNKIGNYVLIIILFFFPIISFSQPKSLFVDIYTTFPSVQNSNPAWNNKIATDLNNLRIGFGYEKNIFNRSERKLLNKLSLVTDLRLRNIGFGLSHSFDTITPTISYSERGVYLNLSNLAILELGVGIKYHEKLANRLFIAPYILARPQYFFANANLNELNKSGMANYYGDHRQYTISKVNKINRLGFAATIGCELLIYNKRRSSYGLNVAYTQGFIGLLDYDFYSKSTIERNVEHYSGTNLKTKGSGLDIGFRYRYIFK